MNLAELCLMLQSDAHDMADDFGEEPSTVELLADEYGLSAEFVRAVLAGNDWKKVVDSMPNPCIITL